MLHPLIITVFLSHTFLQQTVTGSVTVNGNRVSDGVLPYMASVQSKIGHVCGGFLVTEQFVLTAAHCFDERPIHVILGANHKLKDGEKIDIAEKIKHSSFQGRFTGDDLLLLKLKQKVELGKRIQKIQLPNITMEVKEHERCQAAGWGEDEKFKVSNMCILDCKKESINVPHVICAQDTNSRGFSQGDSGGPLVCNNIAVGLLSFNKTDNLLVFVNTANYFKWINEKIY